MIYAVENRDGQNIGIQVQNISHMIKANDNVTAVSMLDGTVIVFNKPFNDAVQEINLLEDSHPEVGISGLENSGPEKSV